MPKRSVLAVLCVLALAAGACRASGAPAVACTGSELQTVREGTLTVAADIGNMPFAFFHSQTRMNEGFDLDVMREVAGRAGLEIRFVNQTFSGIIPGLIAQRYDAVAAAMPITPERRAQVCFSDPYLRVELALMVAAARAGELTGAGDLTAATVAVQAGSPAERWADANLAGRSSEIRSFGLPEDALAALKLGHVDALIGNLPNLLFQQTLHPDLQVVDRMPSDVELGIAVHPENRPLLDLVNRGLRSMQADGTFDDIYRKWFVLAPDDSP